MFFGKEKKKRLTPTEIKEIIEEHYDYKGGETKKLAYRIVDKVYTGKFKNNGDKTIRVRLIFGGKPLYSSLIDEDIFRDTLREHYLELRDYNSDFPFGWTYDLVFLDNTD